MNKNKNGADIKFDINRGRLSVSKAGGGRALRKELFDSVEITDKLDESLPKERSPILGI